MEIRSESDISIIPLSSIISPVPKKNLRLKGHHPTKNISNEPQIFFIHDPMRDLNIDFIILLQIRIRTKANIENIRICLKDFPGSITMVSVGVNDCNSLGSDSF